MVEMERNSKMLENGPKIGHVTCILTHFFKFRSKAMQRPTLKKNIDKMRLDKVRHREVE